MLPTTCIQHNIPCAMVVWLGARLVVPAGKVVPSTFQVAYYDGSTTVTANPVVSVTNAQYETEENSKLQSIQVVKPELIEDFVDAYYSILAKGKITTVGATASDENM